MSLAIKRGKRRGDPGWKEDLAAVAQGWATGGVTGGLTALGGRLGLFNGGMNVPTGPQILPGIQINPPFGGPAGAGFEITGPYGTGLKMGVGEVGEAAQMLAPGRLNGGPLPKGYKWNKTGYFTKGPPVEYHPPGTKMVRIRRRNPLNPRAFDRSLARIESAHRFKTRLARVTVRPKKCAACK
jgi:hypothetical protein